MSSHSTSALALGLALLGLFSALALPGVAGSGGSAPAPASLHGAWRAADAAQRRQLVAALAERGNPAALEFLAWVAVFDGAGHERALAEATLALAPRAREAQEREALAELCILLESEDPVCVQTASLAFERAHLVPAVPAWIELLASESRGVRERARRGLEVLSGLALGPEAPRWRAWHEAELAWYGQAAPGLLSALDSQEEAAVLAALRELSGRRLFRDELSGALAGALAHPSATVRLVACRAGASLGSPLLAPELVERLEDEDLAVAEAARDALSALSGLDLAFDAGAWRAALEL
jgi:hypothetical protein